MHDKGKAPGRWQACYAVLRRHAMPILQRQLHSAWQRFSIQQLVGMLPSTAGCMECWKPQLQQADGQLHSKDDQQSGDCCYGYVVDVVV